jgi:hypothetical protein
VAQREHLVTHLLSDAGLGLGIVGGSACGGEMGRAMWLTRAGGLTKTLEKREKREKEEAQMVPGSRRLSSPKAAVCRAFAAVRRVRRNFGEARVARCVGVCARSSGGRRGPSREMRRMQNAHPAQRLGPSLKARSGRAKRPVASVAFAKAVRRHAAAQAGSAISVAVNAAEPRCSGVCAGSIHARRSPRWMSGSAQKITRARAADTTPSAARSSWSTCW